MAKRPLLLAAAIVCLAFLSAAPLDPEVRAGLADAGYNLFRRDIGGVVSTWDILLALLVARAVIASIRGPDKGHLFARALANQAIRGLFGLLFGAVCVGLLVILATQSDVFVPRDWARSVVPLLYLVLTYFVVIALVRTPEDLAFLWRVMEVCAAALIVYGVFRLQRILSGEVRTLWAFGIPIVFDDALIVFRLPIAVYFISLWTRRRLGVVRVLMLLAMIAYMLSSTRRLEYVLLPATLGLAVVLGRSAGVLSLKNVVNGLGRTVSVLLVGVIAAVLAFPDLLTAMGQVVSTINVFSGYGYQYTGEFRLGEVSDLIRNLSNAPITWLTGYGVGSQWRVYSDLPWGADVLGSYMAYPAKVLSSGASWLPYFHVPYAATLFRVGVLGVFGLCWVVVLLARRYCALIRATSDRGRKVLLLGLLAMLPMNLLLLGDSPDPVGHIWLGLYLGLLESQVAWSSARGTS